MSPEPLSSLVVGLLSAAPPAPPTAEERNVLLWVRGGDPAALPVTEAPLSLGQGGIAGESSVRPRVCAFLGPGATLRGVAAVVKPIVDRAAGAPAAIDLPTLAAALLAYNTAYLQPPALPSWRVGLRVTLPIEIDLGADFAHPVLTGLLVNHVRLAEWAKLAPAASLGALNTPAAPLPLPDPEALPVAVAARIAAETPAAIAGELYARFLANPYEVVFEVVELVRQLRRAGTALGFALTLLRLTAREQLLIVGTTTGGQGALRALWRVLAETDRTTLGAADAAAFDTARLVVAGALGLTSDGAGGWADPLVRRPAVEALEPPLTRLQIDGSGGKEGRADLDHPLAAEDPGGRRQHVLGRSITVGVSTEGSGGGLTWNGWSYGGRLDPAALRAAHGAAIGTAGAADPMVSACLDVAITIAPNEAWLDGARAADKGMLSIGIQQWSIHVNNELTVLLRRFKERNPEQYDLFFGLYGLDVRVCGTAVADEGRAESDPAVVAANPELGTVAPFGRFFPRQATFWGAAPGQPLAVLPVPRGDPKVTDARTLFFGRPDARNAKLVHLPETWCARSRMAALASLDFGLVQLETAAYRFKRIKLEGLGATVAGVARTAPDLFTSEFAAALILDHHINAPGDARRAPARAVRRIPAAVAAMSDDWLTRFAIDYMAVRQLSDKPKRDDRILRNHDTGATARYAGLKPEPGSFGGWPP